MNYSPSAISSFEACPFKFKLVYIDGKKEPQSPALRKGTAVHDFLHKQGQFLTSKISQVSGDFSLVDVSFLNEKTDEIFNGLKEAKEVMLERYVKFPLKDIIISGKIDRVFVFDKERIIITDYKTGKYFENLKDIYKDLQYLIYCWFAYKLYPNSKSISFEIINIQDKKIKSKIWECSYKEEELDKIIYDRVSDILNTKTFLPKENQYCYCCYFQPECNLFKQSNIVIERKVKEEVKEEIQPKVETKIKITKGGKNMEEDRISTDFSYSIMSPNKNIISLKASLSRSIEKGKTIEEAYKECWDIVSRQVETQLGSIDLNKV